MRTDAVEREPGEEVVDDRVVRESWRLAGTEFSEEMGQESRLRASSGENESSEAREGDWTSRVELIAIGRVARDW